MQTLKAINYAGRAASKAQHRTTVCFLGHSVSHIIFNQIFKLAVRLSDKRSFLEPILAIENGSLWEMLHVLWGSLTNVMTNVFFFMIFLRNFFMIFLTHFFDEFLDEFFDEFCWLIFFFDEIFLINFFGKSFWWICWRILLNF